jgi:hypothetical protein
MLIILFPRISDAQEVEYHYPLEQEISLSGSYGELRHTHFHAGIDLRVGGVVGAPVYASADGFVSRVSVSPGGYGNALYVSHPDGRVSVYGHLLEFEQRIGEWVRKKQYDNNSFTIDLQPSPDQFVVSKGEMIGRAGNSGSSGGPHLHFELRDAVSGIPVNPLKILSIEVPDNIRPYIESVSFHSLSLVQGVPVRSKLHSFSTYQSKVVEVTDTFYVAVSAHDRQNNTWSKLAVYDYRYYLDDTLVFGFTPEGVHRSSGRYINSILEYSQKVENNRSSVKSFIEPGCALHDNIRAINRGLFILQDDGVHKVTIEVEDEHGNVFRRNFRVRRSGESDLPEESQRDFKYQTESAVVMPWYVSNRYEGEDFSITFSPGAFYSTIVFAAKSFLVDGEVLYEIGDPLVPLHSSFYLTINRKIPDNLKEKVIFVKKRDGSDSVYPYVDVKENSVGARLSSFGVYGISYDTIPPSVTAHFYDGANLSGRDRVSFTIEDELSEIAEYMVSVDGVWVLAAYDPKKNSLVAELKADVIGEGISHEMVIFVSDRKNNSTTLKKKFTW